MSETIITAPGHYSLPAEIYHADPTRPMSLSSSGAKELVNDCPAQFIWNRQNTVHKRVFDIGNAGHLMVLEPHLFDERVTLVQGYTKDGKPSDGYTTIDAKAQRDTAYTVGKVPLLSSEIAMVKAMRDVLWQHPIASKAFLDGKAEQSLFWRDPEFGIWCRSRPDWMPNHPRYLINYKTADSARPDDIRKQIWNLGYFQSSAWEMDAFEGVFGTRPERYSLVVQSKKPPYLVTVCWLDAEDLAAGAALNRKARGIFARCVDRDTWPDHNAEPDGSSRILTLSIPYFGRSELDRMAERGDFAAPQDNQPEQAAA